MLTLYRSPYWKNDILSLSTVKSFGTFFGYSWGLTQFVTTQVLNNVSIVWYAPLGISIFLSALLTFIERRPKSKYQHTISGRNIKISIILGDLFAQKGSKIIACNAQFKTRIDDGTIENSLQKLFTQKIYNSDVQKLDADIKAALALVPSQSDESGTLYPLGTIASVRPAGHECEYHLLALSTFDKNNRARTNPEQFTQALTGLWQNLNYNSSHEPLNVPLLGMGKARLQEANAEKVIQEIVYSFVTAVREGCTLNNLNIIIQPEDAIKLDLEKVSLFIQYHCLYEPPSSMPSKTNLGQPVEDIPHSEKILSRV